MWIVVILSLSILLLGSAAWWLNGMLAAPKPPESNAPNAGVNSGYDVKLYMIAYQVAAGEKIGCGDGPVEVLHTVTKDDVITGTYEDLLALQGEMYGESGLYNTLAKSDLTVKSTSLDAEGTAHIDLVGNLVQSGECDAPRLQVQLERPAKQFPGVKAVAVTINGQVLSEVLLLK